VENGTTNMNTPNKLTLSRIILTFIFMFFLFSRGVGAKFLALLTFCAASLTDYYDGKIAREKNEVTDFGRFMDPIADKVLIIASFLAFVELNLVPAWMVLLIIFRELVITGLRIFAATKGRIVQAERGGKHKTVSQVLAIFSILVFIFLREIDMRWVGLWTTNREYFFRQIIFVLMIITVVFTLTSGISYLWRNRKLIVP